MISLMPLHPKVFAQQSGANNLGTPAEKTVKVLGISVEGLSTIDEKDVLARFSIQEGEEIKIPGTAAASAIKRLWRQRLFSDIKLEIERETSEGIYLKLIVKEYPILTEVVYIGNDEYDAEDLDEKVMLIKGSTATEQSIEAARQRILKFYEEEGYLRANVTTEVRETAKNYATVVFNIEENPRVIIEKITFHGNNAFDDDELRGELDETKQNNFLRSIFGRPVLEREKFEKDKELLVDFYRENGYRDARVVEDSISYSQDKESLYLDIFVSEGPKYVIRNISWEGNTQPFATTPILQERFGIQKGDVYNKRLLQERLNFSQEGDDISSLYLDRGYLSFRPYMDESVVAGDSVDLKIYLTEGEQFRVRRVDISGNTKTKEHVIRRELYTQPGDLFSRQKIVRSIRQLATLNYFDQEHITPDVKPDPKKNEVDITFGLIEKQTDTFNASAGYSASVGMTGALGLTFNNFSLQDMLKGDAYTPLPHGDGQQLSFTWQFGNYSYRTLSIGFTEPWAFGTPTSVGVNIYDTRQNYGSYIRQSGVSLTVGRRLTWPDDYFSISWTLKYQRNIGGFINFASAENEPVEATEIAISQTIGRNSFDNPIYPRRGSKVSFTSQLSGGVLPGSVDFYKLTGSYAFHKPLSKDLVLRVASEHGYIGLFDKNDYVPYINFFYMGGSGISSLPTVQLRGYDDQSLGVYDSDIDLYTGMMYSKFSTEIRYPLTLNPSASVYVLAFAEAGNLWGQAANVNFADLKRSVGFGIRVYLPIIGLIGLDYGYGFDPIPESPDVENQGWSFQFTFGQFAQ
ncbi:outer membrane protein assembly factor BamA [Chloroherpeton thalassium]|nr:outer membrane protein assembly factor BamA [Chloroherpeton thalassium]